MEVKKSKVLIKFLLNFRQSGDVLFFLNVRRLRGYTATGPDYGQPGIIHLYDPDYGQPEVKNGPDYG